MAHVSVSINGRQYRMACDDGQELHLGRLAHDLDQRIASLRSSFGEIGDMRLTVMAALTLADELSDARQRAHRIEEELAGLQEERAAATDRAAAVQADLAATVTSAAERVEKVARLLSRPSGGARVAIG